MKDKDIHSGSLETENALSVVQAHTQIRDFIRTQISQSPFPHYGALGKEGFKKLCAMRDDLVFAANPETIAQSYPTLEAYGQRVIQWLWDKYSLQNGQNRQLNKAGQLIATFLRSLGIEAQPLKKSSAALESQQRLTEILAGIKAEMRGGVDQVMDEARSTEEEDKQYERELKKWLQQLLQNQGSSNKNIPAEYHDDLRYLLRLHQSGHYSQEQLEEMLPSLRRAWRAKKIQEKI
ncbi:MAG: hypothetical protein AB7J40_04125 [Candidatus Altimarinota bacterium]